MDLFANNLFFRKNEENEDFSEKRGKKEVKRDARNTCLHARVSRFFHSGQLPNWPPPGYADRYFPCQYTIVFLLTTRSGIFF